MSGSEPGEPAEPAAPAEPAEPGAPRIGARLVIDRAGLDGLVRLLRGDGYQVFAPTVRDGAIVDDEIDGVADLPVGVTDVQEAGSYRLAERPDEAVFGYAVGPGSWKRHLFPPSAELFRAARQPEGGWVRVAPPGVSARKTAFFGVRPCELAAMAVQDRVFLQGSDPDPVYAARRRATLVVAVQCGEPAGTCFCDSMGTGPRATGGFDLALTEVVDQPDGRHDFVVEVGSARGAAAVAGLPSRQATEPDWADAEAVTDDARRRMGRSLDTDRLPERLAAVLEHPHWDDVADRCLGCTNCTLVCPTCFCSRMVDSTDLAGTAASRTRMWDSCFALDHSYLHGGSVRATGRDRYRQWLTHKLSTWWDQFGTSGCVGCGRCIAWCPAAIDITAEVRALLGGRHEQEVSP